MKFLPLVCSLSNSALFTLFANRKSAGDADQYNSRRIRASKFRELLDPLFLASLFRMEPRFPLSGLSTPLPHPAHSASGLTPPAPEGLIRLLLQNAMPHPSSAALSPVRHTSMGGNPGITLRPPPHITLAPPTITLPTVPTPPSTSSPMMMVGSGGDERFRTNVISAQRVKIRDENGG